jgi:hypothetical protein
MGIIRCATQYSPHNPFLIYSLHYPFLILCVILFKCHIAMVSIAYQELFREIPGDTSNCNQEYCVTIEDIVSHILSCI